MNSTELQALRRLLFFTQQEAANMIGGGVSHRAWVHWEAGARDVPVDVATRMRQLFEWRINAIVAMEDAIEDAQKAAGGEASVLALCWYASADHWASLPGREPILWRPHCSVLAEIVGEYESARLIEFDGPAYREWLGTRTDSETLRGAWAATIANF